MTVVVDVSKTYDINEDAWPVQLKRISASPETPNRIRKAVEKLAVELARADQTIRVIVTAEKTHFTQGGWIR